MGAALALLPLISAASLGKQKDTSVPASAELPEVVSEQTMSEATSRARRRRGYGSTLLTGDISVDPFNVGKKQLLGA